MPLIGILAWHFARRVMPISREVQERKADLTEAADESVVGIEMVQAFGREDDVRDRFGASAPSPSAASSSARPASRRGTCPGLYFLPGLSIARRAAASAARDVIDGNLTIGQFVLFNSVLLQLAWPLESLGWILNLAQRAVASAGRSVRLARAVPRRRPRPSTRGRCRPARSTCASTTCTSATTRPARCSRGVNLAAGAGEIVAVCGGTGSGKSTLLNLLSRFYDPTEGASCSAACDVRDVELAELRGAVAVVTQRAVLFSVPLRDNLWPAGPTRLGRGARRLRGRGRRDVRRRPSRRLRHADRRARRQPLGRPAPARRARARAPHRRPGGGARRPALGRRHRTPSATCSRACGPRSARRTAIIATQRLSTALAGRPRGGAGRRR